MIVVVKVFHVLGLAVWLGMVVFLSFVVAPSIFGAFPQEQRAEAGRLMSVIFPRYYVIGYGCGGVLLLTSVLLWRLTGASGAALSAAVVGAMLAATIYAGAVIQPRVYTLRPQLNRPDTPADVQAEFDRLHARSVQLNVAVLVGALALAAVTAGNLKP